MATNSGTFRDMSGTCLPMSLGNRQRETGTDRDTPLKGCPLSRPCHASTGKLRGKAFTALPAVPVRVLPQHRLAGTRKSRSIGRFRKIGNGNPGFTDFPTVATVPAVTKRKEHEYPR